MARRSWPLALPALAILTVFILLPLASVLRYSGWDWSGLGSPRPIGLANFRQLLHDRDFWRALRVTAYFALLLLPSFLWLSRTIALAIERSRLERLVKALLFLPGLTTVAGSAVSWYLLYNPNYGLLYELTGLALPWDTAPWAALVYLVLFGLWQFTGYGVLVVSAGLRHIPAAVREAAVVDGATEAQLQRLILLPLLRPTMLFLTVVGSLLVIQSYTAVFLLTRGGPFGTTRVLGYYLYETAFERLELGYGAAITVVALLLALLVALLQVRFLGGDNASGEAP